MPISLPRWFGAARAASLEIVKRFHAEPSPPTIFHYTSSSSLISIVTNNELWLSDSAFLNDRKEIEHGRLIARQQLDAAINSGHDIEVTAMLETTSLLFEEKHDPIAYLACFSLEADELSQWRGYGRGAAPLSIELEYGSLMFGYTSEGHLQQVRYAVEEQKWTFDQILEAYTKAYLEDLKNPKPRPKSRKEPILIEDERASCANSLCHTLWNYIVGCKHPTFSSENEVRFTYIAHDFSREDNGAYIPV